MDAANNVPLNADKLLFAVDLVNHVIISTRPCLGDRMLEVLDRVTHFRDFIRNGFCTNIRKAIDIIDVTEDGAVRNDFMLMVNNRDINREALIDYASTFRDLHFVNGFQPRSFLKFCARVANMAAYFTSDGVVNAPDFAVDIIMAAFPNDISSTELWNELSSAAETYVLIGGGYFEERLPSDTSSGSPDENFTESDSTLDSDYSRGENGNSSSSDEIPKTMRRCL